MSLRNLPLIPFSRALLWVLLCLSSMCLHMSYNSVVYSSTPTNEYIRVLSPQNFSSLDLSSVAPDHGLETCSGFDVLLVSQLQEKANADQLKRMKSIDCYNIYNSSIVSHYGNVLVILNMTGEKFFTSGSVFPDAPNEFESTTEDPDESKDTTDKCSGLEEWAANSSSPIDHSTSTIKNELFQDGEWIYSLGSPAQHYPVLFCLSEYRDDNEEICTVHVSVPLLLITLGLTSLKTLFMLGLLFLIKAPPLLSTGDAVASFLDRSDEWSKKSSLLSKSIVKKTESVNRGWQIPPQRYKSKRLQWQKVTSTLRRASFLLWVEGGLIVAMTYSGKTTYISGTNTISNNSIIANVVRSNALQIYGSALFFLFNGIITSVVLADEWSRYGVRRRGLRVSSNPQGSQRSTYFLSLPYRWSVPLLVVSGLLHWLLSQCLYFISVEVWGYQSSGTDLTRVRLPSKDFITTGISKRPVYGIVALFSFMIIAISFVFTRFTIRSEMPIAGSCSAAIAAACHPGLSEPDDASSRPLLWGAVEKEGGLVHCSFSCRAVGKPDDGQLCA
ncbi:uncharacterized protein BDZ99DRAFT_495695 [Mytilinidion resinicola]|uniref:DUF6536 domain-containing protein n=1 Tax=Mytilinidion resinicola TaxID=574789 RepID=A0A6A6Z051_9PEZI|nr:uncharacterized protein BDZ99DRAFT_495695 [Mytilinidion resinicola]KAF2814158.1 hypothetical protein BDZ99DRAFT_495695 [Mytilinidion resinicola]